MADENKAETKITIKTLGLAREVEKASRDIDLGAIRSTALTVDDDFDKFFKDNALQQKVNIIQPPINQNTLSGLTQLNNALFPAIEAMVTNIDGTGAVIKLKEEETGEEMSEEDEATKKRLVEFFDEVFPGESFVTLRKKLRRDLETVGNAYIEVMRNIAGDLVFLRHIRAKNVRLIKLDDPVNKKVQIERDGNRMEVMILAAERRYAQIVGNQIVFFREMNSTRQLHKTEGLWEGSEKFPIVQPMDRANEVIHLTLIPDIQSAYGIPRWVPQMPSVLGSRQAEEHNLEFFNSGGIPPVLITIAGGRAATEGAAIIDAFFSGQSKNKRRGVVMEIETTGGTLDKEGAATKVEVHRFGAEQVKDSMFEKYDERCEKRVRRAFRLPPLFVGMTEDFNFATAFASYTVAEAQVFQPERFEFDEMVNNLIMPDLDKSGKFEFHSLPITVNDTGNRIEAIKLALEAGAIGPEGVVDALNDLVNLELVFDKDAAFVDISGTVVNAPGAKPGTTPNAKPGAKPGAQPGKPPATGAGSSVPTDIAASEEGTVVPILKPSHPKDKKKKTATELVELASRANELMQSGNRSENADRMILLSADISELDFEETATFNSVLSVMQFKSVDNDPSGLARLAGCSLAVIAAQGSEPAS